MARRGNRKLRLVPIDSTKNIVQFNTPVPTLSVVGIALAASAQPGQVDELDATKTFYVEEGAMLRGFAISLRLFNETGTVDSNSSLMVLQKFEASNFVLPATPAAPSLAELNSCGTSRSKNRFFHIEQAITGSQVSGLPMGFPSVVIPKRFHAMKRGDYWMLWVANNTGNQLRCCGSVIYKWYR